MELREFKGPNITHSYPIAVTILGARFASLIGRWPCACGVASINRRTAWHKGMGCSRAAIIGKRGQDITDLDAIRPAFSSVDTVVHMRRQQGPAHIYVAHDLFQEPTTRERCYIIGIELQCAPVVAHGAIHPPS